MSHKAKKLTGLRIRECNQRSQQPSHSSSTHDRPIEEVGVQCQSTLTHMHKTLRNPDHKQAVGLLVVVAGQLAKHLSQTGVVRPRTDQSHGEDGVQRDSEVVIVAVL